MNTGDRSGQGEASIPYSVAPNTVPSPRSAAVVVGSQSVALSQAAAPCQFRLSRSGDSIGPGGGRLTVDVATLTGCAWTAVSGDGWIAVVSGQSGNAPDTDTDTEPDTSACARADAHADSHADSDSHADAHTTTAAAATSTATATATATNRGDAGFCRHDLRPVGPLS